MSELACGREQMCGPCLELASDWEKSMVCSAVRYVASIHEEVPSHSLTQLRDELGREMEYIVTKSSVPNRIVPYSTINAGLASLLELDQI